MSIWIDIEGYKLMTCVDTSSEEDARMASVKIRSTEEILAGTVTIAVAPCLLQVCLSCFIALQWEVDTLVWLTCLTVAIYEKLIAIVGKPLY